MNKQVLYFQTLVGKVEAKADGSEVKISGYASTGDIDRGNDKVLPTAFTDTLETSKRTSGVAMLLSHDTAKVIGGWDVLATDKRGLNAEGTVRYDVDGCIEKIKNGDLRGLSIGYIVEQYQVEDENGHVMYYSDTGLQPGYDWDNLYSEDAIRVVTKLQLVEISVVATPMNAFAFISSVKKYFAEEVKAFKSMKSEKKTDDDGGEESAAAEATDINAEDTDAGHEGEPAPAATETETTTETTAADAPAGTQVEEGAETQSQEVPVGGESAGEAPAPVETQEDATTTSQDDQVKALEEAKEALKNAILTEVQPLIASMFEKAFGTLELSVTDQLKAFNDTLGGINETIATHTKAFKNIEVRPNGSASIVGGGMVRKGLTDADILRTLGQ